MLITKQELDDLLTTATQDNPIDASHFIINPGYDQRWTIDYWVDGSIGGGTGVWGRGGNYVDFVWENWNTEYADVSQTIEDLPEGWYEVDVQGYYRDGHYTTHMLKATLGLPVELRASVYAYVGDYLSVEDVPEGVEKSPICSFSDGINMVPGMGRRFDTFEKWTTFDEEGNEVTYECQGDGTKWCTDACWSAAEQYFQSGLWWNRLAIYVPEGEPLTIGAMKEDQEVGDWLVVDNWRLKYMGKQDPQEVIDGIKDIEHSPLNIEHSIYNLNGQRVNKAQKGIYIVNGQKRVVK